MNLTNQVPSGSINHTALTQWFDAVLLNITGKYFQANIDITVPETINGLQAFGFTGATDQAYNTLFDVFNGVSNYTQLIGFKKQQVQVVAFYSIEVMQPKQMRAGFI